MPKLTFKCEKCNTDKQIYCGNNEVFWCETCDVQMTKQFPNILSTQVSETVNKYTNTKNKQDQKSIIEERKQDHYWSVEVPRLVQKYSLKICLEQGWVWEDDNGKVHTHTKPPGKR